ncbi:uncharacterized protein MELLADRAFT_108168 [Melampsora larici-populina 98AG31]|uniref:Uncharacterized protein n=1 Tax=Melampsora larici-populina (strain 98AG31 / pathotype 3-4-7) TaxID=747676 RepID=F4RS74_MELLP|nr:uncharacterized protein MELLADRAFT_108168 [Melampsora larici-populina 98AG31]EGG04829.1 hypothetical protein MELLADRAFT_108168 [Melampsora larici-populina 98AG31]
MLPNNENELTKNDPPEPRSLEWQTPPSTRPPNNKEPLSQSKFYHCVCTQIELIQELDIYPPQEPATPQDHKLNFHRLQAFFPNSDTDRYFSEQVNDTQSIDILNLYNDIKYVVNYYVSPPNNPTPSRRGNISISTCWKYQFGQTHLMTPPHPPLSPLQPIELTFFSTSTMAHKCKQALSNYMVLSTH